MSSLHWKSKFQKRLGTAKTLLHCGDALVLLELHCSGSTTPNVPVSSCEVVRKACYMLQVFGQKFAEYTTVTVLVIRQCIVWPPAVQDTDKVHRS